MKQSDLFQPMLAKTYGHQADLFQDNGAEVDIHCETCGEYMVRTESGYVTCPKGHGKLLEEGAQPYEGGLWFEPNTDGSEHENIRF